PRGTHGTCPCGYRAWVYEEASGTSPALSIRKSSAAVKERRGKASQRPPGIDGMAHGVRARLTGVPSIAVQPTACAEHWQEQRGAHHKGELPGVPSENVNPIPALSPLARIYFLIVAPK